MVADALMQEIRIKSGVPQGSVIGPLLFLLFVNDLPSIINVTTLLFADDVKMVSPRLQNDLLQGSLFNVWNRSVNWGLPINPTKCNYITIVRAIPYRSQTLLKTWAFSWTVPSHQPSIAKRLPPKQDGCCL